MKLSLAGKPPGGLQTNSNNKPRAGHPQSSVLGGGGGGKGGSSSSSSSSKNKNKNNGIANGKGKKTSAFGDDDDDEEENEHNDEPIASTSRGTGLSKFEQRRRADPSRPAFGLEGRKIAARPSPASLLMGDGDGHDDDDDDDEVKNTNASSSSRKNGPSGLLQPQQPPSGPNGTSSSTSSNTSRILAKMHADATQIDPTVFSYDEVYDDMKAAQKLALEARKAIKDAEGDAPKYVSGLLKAAEQRKKDRVRAEDKLIERERQAEGEEYKDKEAFVTSAYKEQQEELRRQEEEDRIKEEQAAKRPGGMSEYYKRELAKSEAIHEAAVKAASTSKLGAGAEGSGNQNESSGSTSGGSNSNSNSNNLSADAQLAAELAARGPKSEAEIAREASAALGRHVTVNEEGQIVDKRELLSGGLNVKPRKSGPQQGPASGPPKGFALSIAERRSAQEETERKEAERKKREDEASLGLTGMTMAERQRISRERQSKEMERQLLESQERKRAAEVEKESERVGKFQKRNNDETKIEEMKRKALERRMAAKKKAEEEQASKA